MAKETVKQKLNGVVMSNKMEKTIVVRVERTKRHPKYLKYYKVHKNYKVHDPLKQYAVGQKVTFVSCRPVSKEKRWRVVYEKGMNQNT